MTLWCIIPVKPPAEAKTRLAGVLSAPDRTKLAKTFFRSSLSTVCQFAGQGPVLVISRSAEILDFAGAGGAVALPEIAGGDMNAALAAAATYAVRHGATSLLAVSADLPLLTCLDLKAMIDDAPRAALAPDRHGTGSNALFWPGPAPAPFQFGPGSFARHVAAMVALGMRPRIVRRRGLALDIDDPADLLYLEKIRQELLF